MMKLTMKFRIPRQKQDEVNKNCSFPGRELIIHHTLTLVSWQDFPSGHNHIIEDLKGNV